MSRTALRLDEFDPEVLEAARDVARRAGVPVESWIASAVAPDPRETRRRKRAATAEPAEMQSPSPPPSAPAKPIPAPPAAAVPAASPSATSPPAATSPAQDDAIGASLAAMMRRLDALDSAIAEGREASREASAQALGDIERRVEQLSQQVGTAGPRALGRRGRPLVAEVRQAVEDVRRRQRELDAAAVPQSVPSTGSDASAAEAIPALQAEANRLRVRIRELATEQDLAAFERTARTLSEDIERAQAPSDLAAVAASVASLRAQIGHLASEMAEPAPARLSDEVEQLARRVDRARDAGVRAVDRDALAGLSRELSEIRGLLASLAEPERIEDLARTLDDMGSELAELQRVASDIEPTARPAATVAPSPAPERSDEILGRIDALTVSVERANANPVGDLIGRLENLGETLRRPVAAGEDFASIHGMLASLADKVDRVGTTRDGGSLDALEQQVVTLARRLDARAADPTLANMERTMGDLLEQVAALRDPSVISATVERAARAAVAEAIGKGPGDAGALGTMRADLADLRALQSANDQRMVSTMAGVQSALDRLADRLGTLEGADAAPRIDLGRSVADRRGATTVAAPADVEPGGTGKARSRRRPELPRGSEPQGVRFSEELLEPGAIRPGSEKASVDEATSAPTGDIKTSFIAAARRAAQAAQADLAEEAASAAPPFEGRAPMRRATARTASGVGTGARLRAEFEKRRRPLLLGLAAIVLALGALQAYQSNFPATSATPSKPVPTADAAPPPAAAPALASKPAIPADPTTTQSIAEAGPAVAKAASPPDPAEGAARSAPLAAPVPAAIPPATAMAALGPDLASVPAGLSKLRQSALEGDGAAIWELAGREADGRGMPRDLAVAAKLHGKLAEAGFAPAQFKLAGSYEKGIGVNRDLAQAKLWYGRAADQGNIRSMHNLAVLHAENPIVNGKPDFATASAWFRRAAEYGVRDSQYNLAVLYARGLGVTQDLVQSYAWFAAAAAQGDEEAGRKRDDVAMKLAPKDLAAAKAVAAAYKPKPSEPGANEIPTPKAAPTAAMTLLGAVPPGAPSANAFTRGPRAGQPGV